MTKSPHAFRSIGEVARLVGVATHVLRYWETQFPALSPVKRPDGRRYYRLDDVLLTAGICEALREEGLTIRGARRLIAQDRGAAFRTRGKARLAEKLGLDNEDHAEIAAAVPTSAAITARPTSATPPETARAETTRADVRASGKGAHAPVKAQRPPVDVDTLPLFPDLEPVSATAAPPAGSGDAVVWLARLCATSGALRRRETPLPPAARPLAAALRRAQAAAATAEI